MAHKTMYCGSDVEGDEVSLYTRTLAQRMGLTGARSMVWRAEDHMDVAGDPVVPKDAIATDVIWSTLVAGAIRVVAWAGFYGLVFPFGGTGKIMLPNPTLKKVGFALRMKLSAPVDTNWMSFLSIRDTTGVQFGAMVNHAVGVNWLVHANGVDVDSGIAADTNEHVLVVYSDVSRAYLEIDGESGGSAAMPASWTAPAWFQIYSSATGLQKSVDVPWIVMVYEP